MMIVASAKPDGMFAQAWWIFQDNIPLFWYGIKITLLLAVCGTLIGLLIGLLSVSYTHLDVYKRQVRCLYRYVRRIMGSMHWMESPIRRHWKRKRLYLAVEHIVHLHSGLKIF